MIVTVNGYTDLSSMVQAKGQKHTFYYTDNNFIFKIYYICNAEVGLCIMTNNLVTQPSTFSKDFPTAIQLTNDIMIQ